jgi:hypothetical protein
VGPTHGRRFKQIAAAILATNQHKADEDTPLLALVINLDSRPDKMASATEQCAKWRLEVERIAALDPRRARDRLPNAPIEGGNLGLNASFDLALEVAGQTDAEWVVILEDDAGFVGRFSPQDLAAALDECPPTAGLLKFGYLTGNEWRRDKSITQNLHRLARPRERLRSLGGRRGVGLTRTVQRFSAGSHAVVVRPSKAAELRSALAPYEQPLDHLIHRLAVARPDLVRQTRKSMARQRAFRSDIAATRTKASG